MFISFCFVLKKLKTEQDKNSTKTHSFMFTKKGIQKIQNVVAFIPQFFKNSEYIVDIQKKNKIIATKSQAKQKEITK